MSTLIEVPCMKLPLDAPIDSKELSLIKSNPNKNSHSKTWKPCNLTTETNFCPKLSLSFYNVLNLWDISGPIQKHKITWESSKNGTISCIKTLLNLHFIISGKDFSKVLYSSKLNSTNRKDKLSSIMPSSKTIFSGFLKRSITKNSVKKKPKYAKINKPIILPKFIPVRLLLHWLSREFQKKLKRYLELKTSLNIIGEKSILPHTSRFLSAIFRASTKSGSVRLPMAEIHALWTSVSWHISQKATTSTEVLQDQFSDLWRILTELNGVLILETVPIFLASITTTFWALMSMWFIVLRIQKKNYLRIGGFMPKVFQIFDSKLSHLMILLLIFSMYFYLV